VIPLLHTAISERFRGAARDEALYKSTFTLLTLLYFPDVVNHAKFHQNRFRGFGSLRGRNLPFSYA